MASDEDKAEIERILRERRQCVDCGIETMHGKPHEDYMVKDKVWKKAGMKPGGGRLCIGCLESRLGRPLVGRDFKDLPVNIPGLMADTERLYELKMQATVHYAMKRMRR